jgi:hypothetical protein
VAGDTTYGGARRLPALNRQFLHSYLLRVRSPHDAVERTFAIDLPADLALVLDGLRRTRNTERVTR